MPALPPPSHCQTLGGDVATCGWSVCDHRYPAPERVEWSDCFHGETAGLCFNYEGAGEVQAGRTRLAFGPKSTSLFNLTQAPVRAHREQASEHSFLMIHFSRQWLAEEFRRLPREAWPAQDHPLLGTARRSALFVRPLTTSEAAFGEALRHPPVHEAGRFFWYQAKVLELLAMELFASPSPGEMFCTRQKKIAHERVERVRTLIQENLAEPLALEELGRQTGCSPFYLCRIFSAETGVTISQYLRRERLRKAASLLEAGTHNVTQAALEVGYNSLSHFSKSFLQEMGCCPGLYPAGKHLFHSAPKS